MPINPRFLRSLSGALTAVALAGLLSSPTHAQTWQQVTPGGGTAPTVPCTKTVTGSYSTIITVPVSLFYVMYGGGGGGGGGGNNYNGGSSQRYNGGGGGSGGGSSATVARLMPEGWLVTMWALLKPRLMLLAMPRPPAVLWEPREREVSAGLAELFQAVRRLPEETAASGVPAALLMREALPPTTRPWVLF